MDHSRQRINITEDRYTIYKKEGNEVMSICDSIKKKYIRLSKGQRKVAQFVVDNPNVIATQVASEVGRQAGVSESTVIRFCYAMDFSGFSELQQIMKEYLLKKDGVLPVSKVRVKKIDTPAHAIMTRDVELIENTMQKIDGTVFEQAVHELHKAKQIYILGVRSTAPAAFWLYNSLKGYRDSVHLMTYDERKIAFDLAQMDEDTVLFVVGVNEQQEDVMAVVDIAKRKSIKIIAITDNIPCPLQEKADLLFTIGTLEQGFVACDVVVLSILNALVECMVVQHKDYYSEMRTSNVQNTTNTLLALI